MDIKISLKDERMCAGCPLDQVAVHCKGGFKREFATIREDNSVIETMFGPRKVRDVYFSTIRPRSCLLANERALQVVKDIPEQENGKRFYGRGLIETVQDIQDKIDRENKTQGDD